MARKDARAVPRTVEADASAAGAGEDAAALKRAKRAKMARANEQAAVWSILLFIVLRMAQRWYQWSKVRYLTTTEEQPLATVTDNFLTFSEYAAVKRCALEHPKLRVRGGLNDAGFSKTRGFVVKFNLEGVDNFQTSPDYACFAPVFEKLRLPEANAFVMNVLLCELGDYDQYNADELSVGMHLDTTVGIYSRHMFIAHQVSVLYNSVPEDMVGGELEMFPYGTGYPEFEAAPEKKVTPKENTLVTFRGDAFHQVRSYKTKTGSERVSLVLEQYKIDKDMYGKTVRYLEAFKSNMTMM
jgi:hypothetical protein